MSIAGHGTLCCVGWLDTQSGRWEHSHAVRENEATLLTGCPSHLLRAPSMYARKMIWPSKKLHLSLRGEVDRSFSFMVDTSGRKDQSREAEASGRNTALKLQLPPGGCTKSSPKKLTMTAVKYDETKDFADRKVNIQVLQGKLRNHVHLSHLYCKHESLARVSMKMWCFLNGHAAINGANCTLWSSFSCKTQRVFLRNRDFLGELLVRTRI